MSHDSPPQSDSAITTSEQPLKPFSLRMGIAAMVCWIGAAMLVCMFVLRQFGWANHVDYAMNAGVVTGAAAIVGLLPVWWFSRKSLQGAAMGFMAGMLLRMAVCGIAIVVGGRMEGVSSQAWSLWVAGWYMYVLTVEVSLVGRYLARSKCPAKRPGNGGVGSDVNINCRVSS